MNLKKKKFQINLLSVPLFVHFPSPVFFLIMFERKQPLSGVRSKLGSKNQLTIQKEKASRTNQTQLENSTSNIQDIQPPSSEKFKETQLALPYHTV